MPDLAAHRCHLAGSVLSACMKKNMGQLIQLLPICQQRNSGKGAAHTLPDLPDQDQPTALDGLVIPDIIRKFRKIMLASAQLNASPYRKVIAGISPTNAEPADWRVYTLGMLGRKDHLGRARHRKRAGFLKDTAPLHGQDNATTPETRSCSGAENHRCTTP